MDRLGLTCMETLWLWQTCAAFSGLIARFLRYGSCLNNSFMPWWVWCSTDVWAYGIIASQIPRSLLLRAAFDIGYNFI